MADSDGFVLCPYCEKKTRTKVNKDTILVNFPLFCPKCKQQCLIDLKEKRITKIKRI